MDFVNNDTRQIAKLIRCQSDLSGYHLPSHTGYIVETEAYSGLMIVRLMAMAGNNT